LVEIATGVLGVEEACSGIRSLQATFMASIFLGEWYRLRVGARLVLVGIGILAAFLSNVVRTIALSISAVRSGQSAVDALHDTAGYTTLTACLVIVALA